MACIQARDRLGSVGANLIGTIINVWNSVATFAYGGYGAYGSGYYGNASYHRGSPKPQHADRVMHSRANGAASTNGSE